jgi:hypothetical protein
MSKQFNFFALGKDFDFIQETILNSIGEMFYFPERGTSDEMTPKKILNADDFDEVSNQIYLIPAYLLDSIVFIELDNDKKMIDYRSCPVIEYSSKKLVSKDITEQGRIALFYYGDISVTKAMQQITRKLKTKAQRLPNGIYYAFENARKFANTYQYWVGNPKSNPFKENGMK